MSNTTNLNLFKHDNPEQNTNAFDVEEALNKNWDKVDTYAGNINTDLAEKGTDITNIKAEQITQNTNIQTNANNISSLQSRTGTNETDISNIKTEQTQQNNRIGALEGDNTTNKNNIATLQTDSGHTISLDLNTTTYVLTATLKNKAGTTLNTSSIDLPVEQLVVSVSYDKNTKELVITLKNGEITRVPLGDLVSGLQTEITSSNKLSSDLVDDTNNTHKFVSAGEKETWNAKYNKPSGGIPKTDLTNEVQTSLEKADTALQQHQDISGKEDKSNKVTSIDDESTDIQYPSAKCVYDSQQNQNTKIVKLELENQRLKETLVTTTGSGENITLNKTAELDFVVPPLPEGNTKQNTTEGIQRIDTNETINETTANGVTYSLKNGVFKFNGTSTAGFYVILTNKVNLESGTYTFAPADESGSYTGTMGKYVFTSQDIIDGGQARSLIVKTLNEDYSNVGLRFYIANGCVFNNYQFKINLVKGTYTSSTIPAWEPYTNGASPNPEYEQEVQVVKGDVEVKVENKNFGDIESIVDSSAYYGNVGETISVVVNSAGFRFPILKSNKDKLIISSRKTSCIYRIRLLDSNNKILSSTGYTSMPQIIDTSDCEHIAIMFDNTTISKDDNIQIELGSTSSSYTPHKEQKLPLTLGNIELCKIGDYKDKFEKDNGVWKIPNKILKIDSYNGETITTPYISSTGGLDIGATVYYVGDNALEITDTTLINQLEAIYNTISYYEQTNISGTSSGISPLFDVEAYQNTKLLLEDIINSN